jgi:hypothetical protein
MVTKYVFLFILLAGTILSLADAQPPDFDPECISEWKRFGDWEFENSPGCQEHNPWGTRTTWYCWIERWSDFRQEWYLTVKLKRVCVYSDPPTKTEKDIYATFLPLVINCTSDSLTGFCPVTSSIP